ncbi:Glutamine amidotransferase [Moritella viscosa]|uniref:glutamine amidotransferase-related protein n=1 Tax=Moritella viscosa TaxID=80854 RepID=UPI00090ECF3B|nr:GMP synthase [Moritella viscosa]SGY85394.1 Glutamine amidotransferase [Moritella viscosa]
MRIHFIVHESYEGPGYFTEWAHLNNYQVSFTRVYLNDPLVYENEAFDLLVILGGPQNPRTRKEECPHFDSLGEQAFIKQAIANKKAVIGVCLGAQLIGEALGAANQISPEQEIGYFPIAMTEHGHIDSKLAEFDLAEVVGHWHNDMPGLTSGSVVLAVSKGCPRQIVRYSTLVYGFQCHLEFISEQLAPLIEHDQLAFNTESIGQYIQDPDSILKHSTARMNQLLGGFLDKLVQAYRDC